jgi:hypothetical protein
MLVVPNGGRYWRFSYRYGIDLSAEKRAGKSFKAVAPGWRAHWVGHRQTRATDSASRYGAKYPANLNLVGYEDSQLSYPTEFHLVGYRFGRADIHA